MFIAGRKEGKKGEAEQNLNWDTEDPLIIKGLVAHISNNKFKQCFLSLKGIALLVWGDKRENKEGIDWLFYP